MRFPLEVPCFRHGCHIEPQCPLCTIDVEFVDHLFWTCCKTQRVWNLAAQHHWLPAYLMSRFNHDWLRSFGKINELCSLKEVQKLSFLLWTIWKGRNAVIFENENFNPIACLIKAKRAYAEWRIRNCLSVDDYYTGRPFGPVSKNKIVR